jgi:hypothetical protein
LQKLLFAGTILFLNYPLQELSFAGTIVTNVPCQQSFFISHRLDPVSFEHLVLAPLCEPKSHHIIAVRIRVPIEKRMKNLFPTIFRYF